VITGAWDRDAVVREIRDRIWLHLSSGSTGTSVLLEAAALLRLPEDDIARLGDLHLLLHPATEALLEASPQLLRHLGSTTTRTTETGLAGVRGPVDWPATARRRTLDRTPTVVTHPSLRDNDIPPSRLLALLLREIRDRADSLNLRTGQPGTTGAEVADRGRQAAALSAHRGLRSVVPSPPSAREVAAMAHPRFARRNAALLDAWSVYDPLVRRHDPQAVRQVVEGHGLAVASDGALFEVLVLFRLRDALLQSGWSITRVRLFEGRLRFAGTRGADRLAVAFQAMPRSLTDVSRYVAAQRAHREPHVSDLRPDLVLRFSAAGQAPRWLLVEAKTTVTGVARSVLVRRALHDLLAYRWAYDTALAGQTSWGLGVVWGRGLSAAEHDVGVCTLDRLTEALEAALASQL
jgi:hypothetical protein